jgi:hypothetical protein
MCLNIHIHSVTQYSKTSVSPAEKGKVSGAPVLVVLAVRRTPIAHLKMLGKNLRKM